MSILFHSSGRKRLHQGEFKYFSSFSMLLLLLWFSLRSFSQLLTFRLFHPKFAFGLRFSSSSVKFNAPACESFSATSGSSYCGHTNLTASVPRHGKHKSRFFYTTLRYPCMSFSLFFFFFCMLFQLTVSSLYNLFLIFFVFRKMLN